MEDFHHTEQNIESAQMSHSPSSTVAVFSPAMPLALQSEMPSIMLLAIPSAIPLTKKLTIAIIFGIPPSLDVILVIAFDY
jgi:hypothetical protein